MSSNTNPQNTSATGTSNKGNPFLVPFLMVTSLFFIWGFCHAMLDVLNKHFQNILHVSKTQSGFIQNSVFGAYFLMALPSALLIRRIGYQKGILLGLVVVAIGAFLFVPAGLVFKTFWAFLFALRYRAPVVLNFGNHETDVLDDLGELYRRVVVRNCRLQRLIELSAHHPTSASPRRQWRHLILTPITAHHHTHCSG